jgi:hypothetical protein
MTGDDVSAFKWQHRQDLSKHSVAGSWFPISVTFIILVSVEYRLLYCSVGKIDRKCFQPLDDASE